TVNRGTQDKPAQIFASRKIKRGSFRLAADYEIACGHEKFGQVRCGRAEESDIHAACSRTHGPLALVLVINERGQYERYVAFDRFIISLDDDLVAFAREDGA